MSTNLNDDDIDLSMRAPYIPMNESDDLPLLTEDLMWSAFSDEMSLHKAIREPSTATILACSANFMDSQNINDLSTPMRKSSLAALLSAQQGNDTFKELQKQFANGLSSNNSGGSSNSHDDINRCSAQKLTNGRGYGNGPVVAVNALNIVGGNMTSSAGTNSITNSSTIAFNQSHNTQSIDDNASELIKPHDQRQMICDDNGITDTDPITPISVEEFDDDSFPKSCKCLLSADVYCVRVLSIGKWS